MLTKIGIIRNERNFFGTTDEGHMETRLWGITRKHVLKALNYLVKSGDAYVHFDQESGEHDVVYQEYAQRGTDMVTWIRYGASGNSRDTVALSVKEFKRISRDWVSDAD